MNGLIVVYKPQNMTSFDVIAQLRKKLNTRKIGHSGTLDPMATGVLVCAVNKATKCLPYIGVEEKTYIATLKLGTMYHTGDVWGNVIKEQALQDFSEDDLRSVLESFKGSSTQRVPKVSAKKIDGKRSYDYVFEEKEVEQLYTDINIKDIALISYTNDEIQFEASVSNGTYIRTLCEDIAEKLGNVGAMSALERTQVGIYGLDDCYSLDEIHENSQLLDVKKAIALEHIVDASLSQTIEHGKRITLTSENDTVLVDAGAFFAVYTRESGTTFKSSRGLW